MSDKIVSRCIDCPGHRRHDDGPYIGAIRFSYCVLSDRKSNTIDDPRYMAPPSWCPLRSAPIVIRLSESTR